MIAWLTEQGRTYFNNAGYRKEYRVQLRGRRAPTLWASFLITLILVVSISYGNSVSTYSTSVVQLQAELRGLFEMMMGTLDALVMLAAPILGTVLVLNEYQNRAIDLIQTTPNTNKYFLIGKVLSGFRYIVMLLVLSLPLSAVSVVMGGAAWYEVLEAYFIVGMRGLFLMSIAMPIAIVTQNTIKSILASYGILLVITALLASTLAIGIGAMMTGMGPGGQMMSPFDAIAPFGSTISMGSTYEVFGYDVPAWAWSLIITLILVRLCVAGAGSAMSRVGGKDVVTFRVIAAVVTVIFTAVFTASMGLSMTMGGSYGVLDGQAAAGILMFMLLPLIFCLTFLMCWSYYGDSKHRPGASFEYRKAFNGDSSGGLPYTALLIFIAISTILITAVSLGMDIGKEAFIRMAAVGFGVIFLASLGRIASALGKSDVAAARKMHLGAILLITMVPIPVLSLIHAMTNSYGSVNESIFGLHIFGSLFVDDSGMAVTHTVILAALTLIVLGLSKRIRLKRVSELRAENRGAA